MCLIPFTSPIWFNVHSVPVDDLIAGSSTSEEDDFNPQLLNLAFSVDNKDAHFTPFLSILCVGDRLYSFGGETRELGRYCYVP